MTRKLTLSILGFLLAFNLLAKDRIPLNKHFAPLERSQEDAAYLKVVNPIVDGKQVERIYDLDQRLVRIVSKYFDDRKNLIKTICEDVDEEGVVYKIKEINTKQSACTIYYLKDGQIIGQFYGNEHEVIFGKRMIGEEEVVTSINIFEPGFFEINGQLPGIPSAKSPIPCRGQNEKAARQSGIGIGNSPKWQPRKDRGCQFKRCSPNSPTGSH